MPRPVCVGWRGVIPASTKPVRSVRRIVEQGHRVSDVVRGLRSLVQEGQPLFAKVQVNDAVEEVILLMKRELERAGVSVRTDFDMSLPDIEADKGQLQQVVLNLVRNAIEAMTDGDGRPHRLAISSESVDDGVLVAVTDFRRWYRSRDRRAPFRRALHDERRWPRPWSLDLPKDYQCPWRAVMDGAKCETRRDVQVRCSEAPAEPTTEDRLRMSSPGYVHVVDDDKPVRESLGDLLRSMNYQVTLHRCAGEFLNVELPDAPACLVLDVRLPGRSGLELQQYLTRLGIALPVILMTGFGDIPMSVKGMKAGAIDFLTKPIRIRICLMQWPRRCKSIRTGARRSRNLASCNSGMIC